MKYYHLILAASVVAITGITAAPASQLPPRLARTKTPAQALQQPQQSYVAESPSAPDRYRVSSTPSHSDDSRELFLVSPPGSPSTYRQTSPPTDEPFNFRAELDPARFTRESNNPRSGRLSLSFLLHPDAASSQPVDDSSTAPNEQRQDESHSTGELDTPRAGRQPPNFLLDHGGSPSRPIVIDDSPTIPEIFLNDGLQAKRESDDSRTVYRRPSTPVMASLQPSAADLSIARGRVHNDESRLTREVLPQTSAAQTSAAHDSLTAIRHEGSQSTGRQSTHSLRTADAQQQLHPDMASRQPPTVHSSSTTSNHPSGSSSNEARQVPATSSAQAMPQRMQNSAQLPGRPATHQLSGTAANPGGHPHLTADSLSAVLNDMMIDHPPESGPVHFFWPASSRVGFHTPTQKYYADLTFQPYRLGRRRVSGGDRSHPLPSSSSDPLPPQPSDSLGKETSGGDQLQPPNPPNAPPVRQLRQLQPMTRPPNNHETPLRADQNSERFHPYFSRSSSNSLRPVKLRIPLEGQSVPPGNPPTPSTPRRCVCGKIFATTEDLSRHQLIPHYSCAACGRQFDRQDVARMHPIFDLHYLTNQRAS